jgi:glucose/mannose-6-phosphate isomerase
VVYGGGYLAAVARRWKTQMNENAKNWAFFEEFSELNHNAIVGYEHPGELLDRIQVFMLDAPDLPERIRIRQRVTGELMDRYGVSWERVEARGSSRLARLYSLIALGDFVSYYLAILNRADPTTIDPIDFLKDALARA